MIDIINNMFFINKGCKSIHSADYKSEGLGTFRLASDFCFSKLDHLFPSEEPDLDKSRGNGRHTKIWRLFFM